MIIYIVKKKQAVSVVRSEADDVGISSMCVATSQSHTRKRLELGGLVGGCIGAGGVVIAARGNPAAAVAAATAAATAAVAAL